MTQTNVMLDIETLGTKPGCAILSVGAVAWETGQYKLGKILSYEGYVNPSKTPEYDFGDIDPKTWWWWEGQEEAHSRLRDKIVSRGHSLQVVLKGLTKLLEQRAPGDLRVWSKDPDFDCAILADAYDRVGLGVPWSFWETRSVRTMLDVGRSLGLSLEGPREEAAHDALQDAFDQASLVSFVQTTLIKLVEKK